MSSLRKFWSMKEFGFWFKLSNTIHGYLGAIVCIFKDHQWFGIEYEGQFITRCWRCPANYIDTELK